MNENPTQFEQTLKIVWGPNEIKKKMATSKEKYEPQYSTASYAKYMSR